MERASRLIVLYACAAVSASQLYAQSASNDEATVSADTLRHPISNRARAMLIEAQRASDRGDHNAAIPQLLRTLAKYPNSAAYVHTLLGIEYMRMEQYPDAVASFEKAAALLPHAALIHHNLGLSLLCIGDLSRGKAEVQAALQLAPENGTIRSLYALLHERGEPATRELAGR